MSTLPAPTPGAERSAASLLAPADLAELIGAFNEVTAKLQSAHDQLRGEVARLTRELGEANSALERSRRLAALGEMAAGIAHEIRNPLGSVRLYARMLEQDLTDRPGEQGIALKIAGAARAMDGIVNDVLTFSREFRLRPQVIDVPDLFDRVLESCCHDGVPGWKQVAVVREDRGVEVPEFEADHSLLQQALVNVVRNAFEAMADVPDRTHTLTLGATARPRAVPVADASNETARPEDGAWHPGGIITLTIRDTGPGVRPEVVERMFNPFFTTRNLGTGLGLAIVHRIIDAHAGRVSVTNNTDAPGATVSIELPLRVSARGEGRGEPDERTESTTEPRPANRQEAERLETAR
jgi:signal transduction histidine kinase